MFDKFAELARGVSGEEYIVFVPTASGSSYETPEEMLLRSRPLRVLQAGQSGISFIRTTRRCDSLCAQHDDVHIFLLSQQLLGEQHAV